MVRSSGVPIATSSWLDTSGPSVGLSTDFLSDNRNSGLAVPARYTSGTSWAASGAPSITRHNGVYYLACRQRGAANQRGVVWELYRNAGTELLDSSEWRNVWSVDRRNLPDEQVNTLEKMSIRVVDGTFFLYFCWSPGGNWPDDGTISYIEADTPEGLGSNMADPTTWTTIMDGGVKDPEVLEDGGDWYMLYTDGQPPGTPDRSMLAISNGDHRFEDTTDLANLTEGYASQFGTSGVNVGTILYDTNADRYVYWGTLREPGTPGERNIYWHFAVSDDLGSWQYYDRLLAGREGAGGGSNARYPSYYAENENRTVLALEYNPALDNALDTYIWDYRDVDFGEPAPEEPEFPWLYLATAGVGGAAVGYYAGKNRER